MHAARRVPLKPKTYCQLLTPLFLAAGGVSLKEIDMTTMQSKVCPGLFLCGELINVDGVTGGFNFMNCWGTGYVAGLGAADFESIPTQDQAAPQ
jgi:predicted flavoprotein YhiN